jgi:hypothetical protein
LLCAPQFAMPHAIFHGNRLGVGAAQKRLLIALSYRLGATLAAGAVAVPLEPIPGIDTLYDVGVPIVLIWYWFKFFRDARHLKSNPRLRPDHSKSRGTIDEEVPTQGSRRLQK